MTPEQISAVYNSFSKARSIGPDFGSLFYQNLSSDYPEIKSLFTSPIMESQHTRFVGQLDVIMIRMKNGRDVTQMLQELGRHHGHIGVKNEDFEKFGATLMKVLQELLGAEFDGYLRESWLSLFAEIKRMMISVNDCT